MSISFKNVKHEQLLLNGLNISDFGLKWQKWICYIVPSKLLSNAEIPLPKKHCKRFLDMARQTWATSLPDGN